ncbi:PRAME family member 12-like [Thomomys bottae]
MSIRTPPTLQCLAGRSLLSNKSLAISALKDLPELLFPPLFTEAYAQGCTGVLKATVQVWPFPCLPLGDLEESPDLETLKTILDGLDLLLAKRKQPSQCKLQVLDLRKMYPEIWIRGYPSMARIAFSEGLIERPTMSHLSAVTKEPPLKIALDLTIRDDIQNDLQACLLQWVWERKKRVKLYSKKMHILSGSISKIQKVLPVVSLDSIQELEVNAFWNRETMKTFAPYLGRMKNLHVLNFSKMRTNYSSSTKNLYVRQYASHLRKLQNLQVLSINSVFFLYGQLPTILNSLTTLKTLFLTSCPLKQADVRFLSQCPCTRQLIHLRLRSVYMGYFGPEILSALVEQVASTLVLLALEDCDITDFQLSAILPALSQCSQLKVFSFYGNRISMANLYNLLNHTARLGQLRRGLYPAPLESYCPQKWWLGDIDRERFAQVLASLAEIVRDIRPTHEVQIGTNFSHCRNRSQVYSLGPDGSWILL